MALRDLKDRFASLSLPAPLAALPLLALPVAAVIAGIDLLGADEARYQPAPPPADDAPAWVVARTEGTLPGGCQITAQVFDDATREDGADATLRLVRASATGASEVWTAQTNARGAHRFANLPAGVYHLAAFDQAGPSSGRAPVAAPTVVCQGDGARYFSAVTFTDVEHELTGLITSTDQRAIAGAEIAFEQEATDRGALAGVLRIPVEADGSYRVKLAPGRYIAQLMAPHHAVQTRKLTIAPDALASTMNARLAPAPHVSGVVVDDTGAPVPHALVALGGALDPKAKQVRVRADVDGRFSLPVRLGQDVTLTARADALVANASVGVITQPLGILGVTLQLHEGRTVVGQVTRADGSAHAYGEVRFRVRELGLTGTERADGAGNFTLPGMPQGADVEVWAEGNATGAWGAQVASPGNDQLALVYVAPAY
jgi:hypothetical protein